jgi:hypothetical protein
MADPRIRRMNRIACWKEFKVDRSTCCIRLVSCFEEKDEQITYRVQTRASHGTNAQEDSIHICHTFPRGGSQVKDDAGYQTCRDKIEVMQREEITRWEYRHDGSAHRRSPFASCRQSLISLKRRREEYVTRNLCTGERRMIGCKSCSKSERKGNIRISMAWSLMSIG